MPNIIETLPWTDYKAYFDNAVERAKAEAKAVAKAEGIAEGIAEGKAEAQMDIAMRAFIKLNSDRSIQSITNMLKELGIPVKIIAAARKKARSSQVKPTKKS